jgi:hypothetical protein
MANTISVTSAKRQRTQFQGLFSDMWLVTALWADQDAIADDVSVTVSLTVPGVALGDVIVIQPTMNCNLLSTGQVDLYAYVSAANTVSLKLTNIDETTDALAADAFNGFTVKFVVGRPIW